MPKSVVDALGSKYMQRSRMSLLVAKAKHASEAGGLQQATVGEVKAASHLDKGPLFSSISDVSANSPKAACTTSEWRRSKLSSKAASDTPLSSELAKKSLQSNSGQCLLPGGSQSDFSKQTAVDFFPLSNAVSTCDTLPHSLQSGPSMKNFITDRARERSTRRSSEELALASADDSTNLAALADPSESDDDLQAPPPRPPPVLASLLVTSEQSRERCFPCDPTDSPEPHTIYTFSQTIPLRRRRKKCLLRCRGPASSRAHLNYESSSSPL